MSDDAFEIEHGHAEYEAAELLEQAQANAQALLLGTVAFLRDQVATQLGPTAPAVPSGAR